MNVIIGIDNGLTGYLVAISQHQGAIIDSLPMPTQGKAKGNEVDALSLWKWLEQFDRRTFTVALETPGKHSPGVNAIASMWDSYGAIRSVLETRQITHYRIAPQTWQKAMLPGCEKGQTKPFALAVARRLAPEETWLRTAKSSKEHEGKVDAFLIAEYLRRKGGAS